MFKRINKFLDTPWTWRTYIRLCVVCVLAYVPIAWYYLSEYGVVPSPKECFEYVRDKFNTVTD